jgi:hypothetical protein
MRAPLYRSLSLATALILSISAYAQTTKSPELVAQQVFCLGQLRRPTSPTGRPTHHAPAGASSERSPGCAGGGKSAAGAASALVMWQFGPTPNLFSELPDAEENEDQRVATAMEDSSNSQD